MNRLVINVRKRMYQIVLVNKNRFIQSINNNQRIDNCMTYKS